MPATAPDPVTWSASLVGERAGGLLLGVRAAGVDVQIFTLVYAFFREADDLVDEGDRSQAPARIEGWMAVVDGATPETVEAQALGQALQQCPALERPARTMLEALRFDAVRPFAPIPRAILQAQLERIADATTDTLWITGGGVGDPPADLYQLARAATAAHWLRDWEIDQELGYCNVPAEVLEGRGVGPGAPRRLLTDWVRERVAAVDGWFDTGLAVTHAIEPLRLRLLFRALAWRYRRMLRLQSR